MGLRSGVGGKGTGEILDTFRFTAFIHIRRREIIFRNHMLISHNSLVRSNYFLNQCCMPSGYVMIMFIHLFIYFILFNFLFCLLLLFI